MQRCRMIDTLLSTITGKEEQRQKRNSEVEAVERLKEHDV